MISSFRGLPETAACDSDWLRFTAPEHRSCRPILVRTPDQQMIASARRPRIADDEERINDSAAGHAQAGRRKPVKWMLQPTA